jgi:LAO/AO transport system kinase
MWWRRRPLAETSGSALAERLIARDREAVAAALNLVDDRREGARREARVLLEAIEAPGAQDRAVRTGLTGAPGVGKSTLLDALVRRARSRDETVGLVAVDPSSRRTGGALLGDRVRVRSGATDPGVFFRSMAARDRLGGLAEGARAAVLILGAAFDRVLVETVGVGQSEGEIADLVDTLVFVAQPGAGDLMQSMKAGVLELPDIVAVNKADMGPMAERTANELEAGMGLGEGTTSGWRRPVLRISAQEGTGLDALEQAISEHRVWLQDSGELTRRRLRGRNRAVEESLSLRYGSYGIRAIGGASVLGERLASAPDAPAAQLLASLSDEIESALARGGAR